MKKIIFRTLLGLFVLTLVSCKATAQSTGTTTHIVKEGETLQSIAKTYQVTPYSILVNNQNVRSAQDVKLNMSLVIPTDRKPTVATGTGVKRDSTGQIAPTGFARHRVKRKETIFSITQQYDITEEQLKKYNKELYASTLKKGMVLRIPEYPEVAEETELDFETYTVSAKETRWSIAHKYGISVDSLVALNPDLPKNSAYLAVGQELKLPRPKGDSLKEQNVAIFESYTVPKSIGLFRISQDYGISMDSIIKLNPEIAERNGLKEGMVIRLPKRRPQTEIVNTDNYIFYEVKPKQNIFRLTQNLKISRDSLFALNPELENGLKAGMVLKLPKSKTGDLEVKNALVLDAFNLVDSVDVTLKPRVLYLLPFRLDRINLNNKEKTEAQIKSRRDVKYALGLYTGALVALDSIKKLGLSVDAKFLDTQLNLEHLKNSLRQERLNEYDAVVGPVSPGLLSEVSVKATAHGVPVVAPFASTSELSLNNVFFSMPNDAVLRDRLLDYAEKKRTDENLIIIADQKSEAARDSILARFPMARVAKMSEDGSLHLVDFQTMISEQKENWVFVETKQPNLAASITSILNASNLEMVEGSKTRVKMFTTNFNDAFDSEVVSKTHLSNLDFVFPSAYKESASDSFSKAYRKKFGMLPDRFAVRGFDLTYDLLLKLAHKKNLFETSRLVGLTEYSGNRFNYYDDWSSGYFNEGVYLMQYDELRIKEIDIE